jgi:hypothetical protein
MLALAAATATRNSGRAHWMVADDNETLLDLVATLLEALGIAEAQRFNTPAEALAALSAAPE